MSTPVNDPNDHACDPAMIARSLRDFYSVYNPAKKSEATQIVDAYRGNVLNMNVDLHKKYNNYLSNCAGPFSSLLYARTPKVEEFARARIEEALQMPPPAPPQK
jgi:hypothetical protein